MRSKSKPESEPARASQSKADRARQSKQEQDRASQNKPEQARPMQPEYNFQDPGLKVQCHKARFHCQSQRATVKSSAVKTAVNSQPECHNQINKWKTAVNRQPDYPKENF